MLFSGIVGFIAVSAFWTIAGILLIVGGLLAIRKGEEQKENRGDISLTEKLGKMGIPGFRSGKKWKMVVAIFGYFLIFIILLALVSGPPPPKPTPQQPVENIQTITPTPIPSPVPTKTSIIKHFFKTANAIGMYNEAPRGKIYLIVTVDIENKGYGRFSTNSLYWKAEVNKLKYSTSSATYSLNDKLELVDVLDGGKVKGSIAFEVPEGTNSYTIYYNAPFTNYNIVWEYVNK